MLDKSGPTPLYLQLKSLIEKQIEDGLYQEGEAIPSERELCQAYGVSRITVREALGQAIAEGLLSRRQGKGTFVARRKIDQSLEQITAFERTITSQGLQPVTALIDIRQVAANGAVAAALKLSKGTPLVKLMLLGKARQEPLALYTSYFPVEIGVKLGEKAVELSRQQRPFTTLDLHRLSSLGLPARARQTFEAALATGSVARLLGLKDPAAIFTVTSIFETGDQAPLEYRVVHYRGDRYRFNLTRQLGG